MNLNASSERTILQRIRSTHASRSFADDARKKQARDGVDRLIKKTTDREDGMVRGKWRLNQRVGHSFDCMFTSIVGFKGTRAYVKLNVDLWLAASSTGQTSTAFRRLIIAMGLRTYKYGKRMKCIMNKRMQTKQENSLLISIVRLHAPSHL